jgi:hypothetical protein
MSAALEDSWSEVIGDAYSHGGPPAIAALVTALDRRGDLQGVKDALLAATAAELCLDGTPPRTGKRAETLAWLEHVLASGRVRVPELHQRAAAADIGWRLVEAMKAEAGAVATQRRDGWWWGARPHRPQAETEPPAIVDA